MQKVCLKIFLVIILLSSGDLIKPSWPVFCCFVVFFLILCAFELLKYSQIYLKQ